MTVLSLRGIEKRFGATAALAGVDLDVRAGKVHAIIGENGAGKSTLMNVLAGSYPPEAGEMRLSGAPYAPRSPHEARRRGVAHVHQELSLCPHLSVAENILMGAEPASWGFVRRGRLRRRAARLLEEFGRGGVDPLARTGRLPLPDRQVIEICRALAGEARLLLLDEPTSTLPRDDVARLFRLIRQLRDRGIAILYVSHFLEEVREIADRCTILRDGRSVGSADLASVGDSDLIAMMVGRAVESVFEKPRRAASAVPPETLLEVRDLAAPPRVRSASFDLRRGEILGIAGLVGSGRTELVRSLFGLSRVASGSVRRRGEPLRLETLRSSVQIRNGLGYVSEDREREGLALPLSIADNVTLTRLSTCARAGWIDRRRQAAQTGDVMRRLRVKAAGPHVPVRRLSGGNRQKIAFGRLLHQDPEIFLLDEPGRGIDVAAKAEIYREIAALADRGKAVLMVSSYLPELMGVCDRIAVMSRGRLSPARPAAEWTPETILATAIGEPA